MGITPVPQDLGYLSEQVAERLVALLVHCLCFFDKATKEIDLVPVVSEGVLEQLVVLIARCGHALYDALVHLVRLAHIKQNDAANGKQGKKQEYGYTKVLGKLVRVSEQ